MVFLFGVANVKVAGKEKNLFIPTKSDKQESFPKNVY